MRGFFLALENNCFQSPESHQLSTNIRITAHLLFYENPMKPGHVTGNGKRLKRQRENESWRQNEKIQL